MTDFPEAIARAGGAPVKPAGVPPATKFTPGVPFVHVPVAQVELAGRFESSAAKPHTPLLQTAC